MRPGLRTWAGACLLLAACGPKEAAPPLNLILISLDTCRADRLSCYGAERPNSPFVDRLAAESAAFSDCLTACTVTAPSHRSLFTSQYVSRHGIVRNGLPANSPYTLASLLHAQGYATAAFVGGGPLVAKYGLDQGFDVYESSADALNTQEGLIHLAIAKAEHWLDTASPGPFFLFVHGFDPHCPYTPPPETAGRYSAWYTGALDPKGRCGRDGFEALMESGRFGPEEQRYISDLYDEKIVSADMALGRFLDDLRRRGLLERSLLVFVGDHGESLGEHQWVGHARLWEEEQRVPFLIRFPGGQYAGRYGDPVQLVDVLPTVLSCLQLPAPEGVQGLDLMPRLRGGAPLPDDRLRLCQVGTQTAARAGPRWKIVAHTDRKGQLHGEVYDLENDPDETQDLYGTAAGRSAFDALYAQVQDWRQRNADLDEHLRATALDVTLNAADRAALAELGYGGAEDGGIGPDPDADR